MGHREETQAEGLGTEEAEQAEAAELSGDELEQVAGGGATDVSNEIVQGNRGPQAGN